MRIENDEAVKRAFPLRGPRFVWEAARRPAPVETDGAPIRPRKLPDGAHCASCGESASYRLDDAISDSFTTVKNASRAWAFGGDHLCAGCVWACKTLALRCCLWFARLPDERGRGGVWFVPMRPIVGWPATRPDPLAALLAPPPPPFVAGLPLYGVDHGGEANAHRAVWWDDDGRMVVPTDPLIKLQSKHTALYSTVSICADRYRLQVDDTGDFTVDVPVWRRLRIVCDALLADLRAGGVGAVDARNALLTGAMPRGAPVTLLAAWWLRTLELRPYLGAPWWPLFTSLLLMPELTKTERVTRPRKTAAHPEGTARR